MKKTQKGELLKYLRRHRGITQRQASSRLHIDRLSARVFDLRKAGHIIDTYMITVNTPYGKTQVAEYRLTEDDN